MLVVTVTSLMASIIIGTMIETRILDSTRKALARINWFGSYEKNHTTPQEKAFIVLLMLNKICSYLESFLKGTDRKQG